MTAHDNLNAAMASAETARIAALAEYSAQVSAAAACSTQLQSTTSELNAAKEIITLKDAEIARLNALLNPPVPPPPAGNPPLPAGWTKELMGDYFSGIAVDTGKWNVRNDGGQDNSYCLNRPSNAIVANGILTMPWTKVTGQAKPYVGAYLDTNGKSAFDYGRWEARLRFPFGSNAFGLWPAFWLRPEDGGLGEIDMMEAWPRVPSVAVTVHHDYVGTVKHIGQQIQPTVGDPTAWHVYAVEKEVGAMRFYVDNVQVWSVPWSSVWTEAFDRKITVNNVTRPVRWNIRLNTQISGWNKGTWGGLPDANTDFSKTFDIDYVRVLGR